MLKNIDRRWLALFVLCLGDLMIVLDLTVVNVALPSIRQSLGFTEAGLVWVINVYMLVFAGLLLLGGRLGDLYGNRRLFLFGTALFTLASLACGLAYSKEMLIVARGVQAIGGAIFSAIALALIVNLFTDPDERARAMGVFGFVASAGGAIGVVIGGILTSALNWHWIFLINLPIGIGVLVSCFYLLPKGERVPDVKLDIVGAITITASLMLAVYGIVGSVSAGWLSTQTLGTLGASTALFMAFLYTESRVAQPLVPLAIFKKGAITTVSILGILWSVGMFAWFFLAALYLQLVLGYSPLEVGLSFLPANVLMAVFSLSLSAKIVKRYKLRRPIIFGMLSIAAGLAFFALAPASASYLGIVLPAMLLLGLGAGVAFNPVLLAGMGSVPEEEAGLASGVLNTAFNMGGSIGLAILASIAAARTSQAAASGLATQPALLAGYHLAFAVGVVFILAAAIVALKVDDRAAGSPALVH